MRRSSPGIVASTASRLPGRALALADRLPGRLAPPLPESTATPRVAIIGSGFGGLGMAIRLKEAGIETFTIYEKAAELGGTWRDNTYPGAGCDVPSHLYSFSFAPKHDWSRRFPVQTEILDYLHECADRYGIRPHLRTGVEITSASFDEDDGTWTLRFADGGVTTVDVVVAATGQLSEPNVPDIEGIDDFAGTTFHSARWDHDHDLTDEDVAVIGIGASAIQFVPAVAERVRSMTLFQRSVNYVAPKPDGAFSERAKWAFAHVPGLDRLYRFSIWLRFDARFTWFRRGSWSGKLLKSTFQRGLEPMVSDELPRDAVIPDYPVGCKRLLISNDWYPTLLRPEVSVVTDPVERIDTEGVTAGGRHHPADTIIFGTGFRATSFLGPIEVKGRQGRSLQEAWEHGAEAHLGITVAGFPNLFLLYGPNTNLGHNSIIFMLERQISYVIANLRRLVRDDLAWMDVRPEVQAASTDRVQDELADTVWAAECHSWYKNEAGRITNNWSARTWRYWVRTLWPRRSHFEAQAR